MVVKLAAQDSAKRGPEAGWLPALRLRRLAVRATTGSPLKLALGEGMDGTDLVPELAEHLLRSGRVEYVSPICAAKLRRYGVQDGARCRTGGPPAQLIQNVRQVADAYLTSRLRQQGARLGPLRCIPPGLHGHRPLLSSGRARRLTPPDRLLTASFGLWAVTMQQHGPCLPEAPTRSSSSPLPAARPAVRPLPADRSAGLSVPDAADRLVQCGRSRPASGPCAVQR